MSKQNLLKNEELIGKSVVNAKAEQLGVVKDVAYDASGKKALIISSSEGVDKIYPFDQVKAIKDVILLDESQTSATPSTTPVVPVSQTPPRRIPASPNQPSSISRFTDPIAKAPPATTKICPTCRRENRLQSKFCVQCGKLL